MLKLMKRIIFVSLMLSLVAACAPAAAPAAQPAATTAPTANPPATAAVPATSAPTVSAPTVSAPPPESAPASIAAAEKLLAQFVKQDYAGMIGSFDAAMTTALPQDKLKQAWDGVNTQFGAYQSETGTKFVAHTDKYDVILISVKFEKGALGFRVSVDTTNGQIAGLQFVPAEDAQPLPYTVPAYVDQSKFEETDVTIGKGEWQLPGTLTMPKGPGPFAAIVLVHGSGPNDRDETIGPNRPFKDLAWGLASQGVAVLRYDKRTKVYGEKIAAMTVFTVKEETIDDAVLAAELLRQTPNIDPRRVFVLGHSLGGYLAPRIGQADAAIAGLIVLAGAARPLEDVMSEQYQYIASLDKSAVSQSTLDEVQKQIAAVKALKPGDESRPPILGLLTAYWLDLQNYQPAELAKTLTSPVLILQGERDYQVTLEDFKVWQAALSSRSNVQFKTYPDLNHLFETGSGKSTPQEYQQGGSLAVTVIDDIAAWVKQH
jgi:dienelactone hydrolase